MLKEPFHTHPLMGTYRSGQREHVKNVLNIAINRELFFKTIPYEFWTISFHVLEVVLLSS